MNPYIIGPYRESDTGIFLGRTKEIEGLYRSFLLYDYLVCYANSGEGKSSILNAGLFPKLRNNKYFPISIRFRFGEKDIDNFDKIINTAIDQTLSECDRYDSFETSSLIYDTDDENDKCWQKELINNHVWLRLRYSKLKIKKENGEIENYTPVLVFDQFEEVFTNPESELWTKSFFCWLEKLSTDVCPHEILDELQSRIDEDSFPIIRSSKSFKAIFSLRSEYVGNIDYWGLQHYYIPDFKNNRYFLKPLTPEGAKEIVMQPNGIDITLEECDELIRGCSENIDCVSENMPCVPASVLSIVCHELYGHTEQQRKVLLKSLRNDKNATIENILENYYLKLLRKSGINDDKTRDAFENALVDDRGNRKRVETNHKDFSFIAQEQIQKLIKNNLLRVVSCTSDKLGEVVELPHDKFCGFIMNHKNKRFEEFQARNNSLKEWLSFTIIGIILGVAAWFFHNILFDSLVPLISDFTFEGSHFVLQNVEKYNYQILGVILLILSAILTPCSILSFAKQWKKTTICLSSCGVLIYIGLIGTLLKFRVEYVTSINGSDIWIFVLLLLLLHIGIMLYTVVRWKVLTKLKISSWPLWGSWFVFFCFFFGEFLRSLKIGVSTPSDSFYFVILLPMLLLAWTWTFFKIDIPKKRFFCGRYRTAMQVLLICGLLAALALNNAFDYACDCKFNKSIACLLFLATLGAIVYFLWNIKSLCKRIIAVAINVFTLIVVYVLNLGYNPLVVDYNNVVSVYNWRTVQVKDHQTNLTGICDPIDGDTIMPCVSLLYRSEGCMLSSSKFKNNPIYNGAFSNSDSSFVWKNDLVNARLIYSPVLEEHMRRIVNAYSENRDTLLSSRLDYYSTKLYREIRDACLKYVIDANANSLEDIKSLILLDSLQNIAFKEELNKWDTNKKVTVRGKYPREYDRDRIDVIEEDDVCNLLSVIARNMYLYVLKDRILQKDFPSIFALLGHYQLLFFSSVPGREIRSSFKLIKDTFNINIEVLSNDLINRKCFAWYDLFIELCCLDIKHNSELFSRFVESAADQLKDILSEREVLRNRLKDIAELDNTFLALKAYAEFFPEYNVKQDRIKAFSDSIQNSNTIEAHIAFDVFSKEVLECFFNVLEKEIVNPYNAVFENLCKSFMSVREVRGFVIIKEYERFETIRNKHSEFLNPANIKGEIIKGTKALSSYRMPDIFK